jgi:peptide/nickel transport system substrate-binding protein
MKKLFCLILVLLSVFALFIVGCSTPSPTSPSTPSTSNLPAVTPTATTAPSANAAQPQYGGVLVKLEMGTPQTPIGWPPEMFISGVLLRPVVEGLLLEDPQGQIKPRLATAWEIAPDKKSITFTLRKGVKFHDGTDWNAQAAKFNMDALKDGKVGGTSVWTSIDIVDDYTIRLNISQFENTIFSNLAGIMILFVSPTAVQKNGIEWARWNPVGTGPFKFVSYERDVSMKFERFDNYWQTGKPYLDGIEIVAIGDQLTQVTAFEAGEGHITCSALPSQAAELQAMGFQLFTKITKTFVLMPDSVNVDSPWSNLKVRQAAEYAIDKEGIAQSMGYGFLQATYQMSPENCMGHDPKLEERKYNVAKAKQLLAEAGYPNGFTTDILIDPVTADMNILGVVQSNLKAVGIDATLVTMDRGKLVDYRHNGWHNGLVTNMFSVYPNYVQGIQANFSSDVKDNVSMARSAEFQNLLNQAMQAISFETQSALCQEVIDNMYDESMMIPLFAQKGMYWVAKGVHDTGIYTTGSVSTWTPENTWLEKSAWLSK